MIACLRGWMVGWLDAWSVEWLAGWLAVGRSVGRLFLVGWLGVRIVTSHSMAEAWEVKSVPAAFAVAPAHDPI